MPLLYSLHLHLHYTCLVALQIYSLHVFNLGLNGETFLTQHLCETSTTDLTEGESGGNNCVVYMGKHSALYIHERTKQ
jgi:hypothetical protein